MNKVLVTLDIGTSSTRALVFDQEIRQIAVFAKDLSLKTPRPDWVEQDPLEIWQNTLAVLRESLRWMSEEKRTVAGLAITNQRETTIVWSQKNGLPVYPAIVWQDRRTANYCALLKKKYSRLISEKTGLRLDPYFSASKLAWILERMPGARKAADAGALLFGTVDSWVIWNLTGRQVHATDVSNASRTLLFNLSTLTWDEELLKIFSIPESLLPEILPSYGAGDTPFFGKTDKNIIGAEIPILAVAGDQSASLFGERAWQRGDVKATYGTGGFVLMNIGSKLQLADKRLVTTIAWAKQDVKGLKPCYAWEGSIYQSGGILKWLKNNLGIIKDYSTVDEMIAKAGDDNVVFAPALSGLGAPWWQPQAKALIGGLSLKTTASDLVRAGVEAAGLQVEDILEIWRRAKILKKKILRIDGGLSLSDYLCQFQADLSGVKVARAGEIEATGRGVAMMAAESLEWPKQSPLPEKIFKPRKIDLQKKKIAWRKVIGQIKKI